jgi:hypothetical protein
MRLSVRVLTSGGGPAAGATVYATVLRSTGTPAMQKWTTDAQGRIPNSVALSGDAQCMTLIARAGTGEVGWKAVYPRAGSATVELRLSPPVRLTGRLLRLDGRPAADVSVWVAVLRDENDNATLIPAAAARKLFRACTGAEGLFVINGLPRRTTLKLGLGNGLALAPGSSGRLPSDAANAGVLIAVQPAVLRVQVNERASGRPAAGVGVLVIPAGLSMDTAVRISNLRYWETAQKEAKSDGNGLAEFRGLVPGDYEVLVQGSRKTVTLREGETVGPVPSSARRGPVEVVILGDDGKPVDGLVDVELDLTSEPRLTRRDGTALDHYLGSQNNLVRSRREGHLSVPESAWQAPYVRLHAARGVDAVEWSGSGVDLPALLELRLRPNVLIKVTGRLVDPPGRPLARVPMGVLRWNGHPDHYITIATAGLTTDRQGRFTIEGLPRGATFSLTPGSSSSGDDNPRRDFLSPRFRTSETGTEQDLGTLEARILPEDRWAEVLEGAPGSLPRAHGLLPPPTKEDVIAAREAFTRYRAALESGDARALYRITSRASEGWLPSFESFLLYASLRPFSFGSSGSERAARPLRFVPRATLGLQLLLTRLQQDPYAEFGAADLEREAGAGTKWVYLAFVHPAIITVGAIAHFEQGEWRVAKPVVGFLPEPLLQGDPNNPAVLPLSAAGFRTAAPPLAGDRARESEAVGERFLRAWSRGDHEEMRALCAPASPEYADTADAFKLRLGQRLDGGFCPLAAPDAAIRLAPVEDLTVWETAWLARYPLVSRERSVFSHLAGRLPAGFPGQQSLRGEVAVLRYEADGRGYLLLLLEGPAGWRVLEPAIPA